MIAIWHPTWDAVGALGKAYNPDFNRIREWTFQTEGASWAEGSGSSLACNVHGWSARSLCAILSYKPVVSEYFVPPF